MEGEGESFNQLGKKTLNCTWFITNPIKDKDHLAR